MVHSVYSDKSVFLRELIANAADACERLRYEAIAEPALLGDDVKPRITLSIDAEQKRLTVEDNGIGMSRDEMAEALGTIARSGTKAFLDRIEAKAARRRDRADRPLRRRLLFGLHGGRAGRGDLAPRRDAMTAWLWSSDGKGTFAISAAELADAPARGTRVVLHLMDDAKTYAERFTIERLIKAQSGHVPVPIAIVEKAGAEPAEISDGAALWAKPKSEISAADYTDFYRSIAGQFDEPAATIHYRAEGRQDYTTLLFIPGSRPFDLFDPDRKGRIKLYVKRVFITDDADILPRYLRFVRGLVDSADLPLNVSREKIQESPLLGRDPQGRDPPRAHRARAARRQGAGNLRENLGDLRRGAQGRHLRGFRAPRRHAGAGAVQDHGVGASGGGWRSLKDYVGALKTNQTAIYYLAGDDLARLESSPHLEGFRARGIEVLLLPDPVDSFWVMPGVGFDGKPFKSVTQGAADLALIPRTDTEAAPPADVADAVKDFLAFVKTTLGDAVAEVRASERLTDSAVCLVGAGFRAGPGVGANSRRRRAVERGVEADPRGQSAARHRRRAGQARRRRARLQGRCRASVVRRGARARRRAARGCAAVFRSARPRARTRPALIIPPASPARGAAQAPPVFPRACSRRRVRGPASCRP